MMCLVVGAALMGAGGVPAAAPVLARSDVVFMYQSDRRTYVDYGATVLAWGGKPDAKSLAEAQGVRWLGSVGMVTEFARYYDRFPGTYADALCRDANGGPVKVPWLTDHQHNGIPYWWCCTNQPQFRTYLRERVTETIEAGAVGLHIDDHMGTSGGLWLGICFCDRCVEGFRAYLAERDAPALRDVGVGDPRTYDFRAEMRAWLAADRARTTAAHPVWPLWTAFQCRAAAAFMAELRDVAKRAAGKPVPVGANAGLLWPLHLADYKVLDLFSAETDHHAESRKPSDAPVLAYRLADAVGKPYASTASGGDWAFIKNSGLHGLVRTWVALSYAAGHRLMAPHRQWCYTPEKGTHWYDGPAGRFAPLYRFVRANAALLDGYETYADVDLLIPHRSFRSDAQRWISAASGLGAANLSFGVVLAGDDIVDKPLRATDLPPRRPLVAPTRTGLDAPDARLVRARADAGNAFTTWEDAARSVRAAVQVTASGPVRAFPRVRKGSAVIHLVSFAYDPARDDVEPLTNVRVSLNLRSLGVPKASRCRLVAPDRDPVELPIVDGVATVPSLGLWALIVVGRG